MMLDNEIYAEDLAYILRDSSVRWDSFRDATILLTGGTGHIGSTIASALLYANRQLHLNLRLFMLVRDLKKAHMIFDAYQQYTTSLYFLEGDVQHDISSKIVFDYVLHCASPTASSIITNHPMQVIYSGVLGLINLIEYVKESNCKGFVYLSSMEAYGEIYTEQLLTENMLGMIDLQNIRNCYPETKRMCEMICRAASLEYNMPVKAIRLAQTFGPGISKEDKRVFAMMARCAMNHNNIILKTKGESKHAYLYTAQAITAILCVLLNGEPGQVYNAANPNTYCSIYEMAQMVCREFSKNEINVVIDESGDSSIYPKTSYLNMDVSTLQKLGWNYSGTLKDMYERMIKCMI